MATETVTYEKIPDRHFSVTITYGVGASASPEPSPQNFRTITVELDGVSAEAAFKKLNYDLERQLYIVRDNQVLYYIPDHQVIDFQIREKAS